MKNSSKLLFVGYLVLIILTIIYSFTQVDLNLTLSSYPPYQTIQNQLTQIGYYNRNLSGIIFLLLLGSWFGLYLTALRMSVNGKIDKQLFLWILSFLALLILAYPAFSHDLFNYMFDARIATKYGLSPAFFKALDFAGDPWIRFMRWTHRYFPYGPGWLILTLIPSWLGREKFVLTLILFKLLFFITYLINLTLIRKIIQQISPSPHRVLQGMIFFGLNPLIIYETLVSPHNEAIMLTFVLLSLYLYRRRHIMATTVWIISVSIKFMSLVLLPLLYLWREKINQKFFEKSVYLWLIALIPLIWQRELYAWYFIPVIGLASLTEMLSFSQVLTLSLGGAALLRYWPVIWQGDYSSRTFFYQNASFIIGFIVFFLIVRRLWRRN